jgi:hypothetical protein
VLGYVTEEKPRLLRDLGHDTAARRAGATDILLEGLTRVDSPTRTRIVGAPPAHAP